MDAPVLAATSLKNMQSKFSKPQVALRQEASQ